ncbi:MAG: hypothetical protein O7G30_13285 [Proteobacteria bacterium]|nr:hypothetical protein [Pseudomonadota bacterium]
MIPGPIAIAGIELGWTQLAAAGWLLLLTLVYWIRASAQVGRSPLAHLFFHVALLGAATAVFATAPFTPPARAWVERTGLPAVAREADRRIAEVEALPAVLWDALVEPFGDLLGEEPEPPEIAVAAPGAESQEDGALEAMVVPAVEGTVVQLLRLSTFGTGAVVMIAAFLLRSTTSNASALRDLRRRVAALEERPPPPPSPD